MLLLIRTNFSSCSSDILVDILTHIYSHVSACPCREDEDRQMEAAIRASMAQRRQEERGAVQERSVPKHCREEKTERTEPEEPIHRTGPIKPTSKPPGWIWLQIFPHLSCYSMRHQ